MKHKFAVILIVIICISIGIGALLSKVIGAMDDPNVLSMHELTSNNRASLLYAKNDYGKWVNIGEIHGSYNRIWVPIDKIPKNLQNAFVAIEDQRFYTNNIGIDPRGILRAIIVDAKAGFKPVEGASTITQQLIKNTVLSSTANQKVIIRKIKEAVLAWQMVHKYSKSQILEAYLNTIYLGGPNLNIYGVQAAALGYFDKNVSQLDLAQCAMIAGITDNPVKYSPYDGNTYSFERQHLVLQKMLQLGYITKSQYDEAINEKLVFRKSNLLSYSHEYFIDQVINDAASQLEQKYQISRKDAINKLYNDGLKIYTTMNVNIQSDMEKAFKDPNLFPVNNHIKDEVQGAMVVIDWRNGEVKGIVGGRNNNQKLVFNRATQAYRQPGSSIKPLTVYAPALESGLTPMSIVNDEPISIDGWSPHNYEKTYSGPVTLIKALTDSINIPAVKVVQKIGINKAAEYGRKFGLDITKNDMYLPALALGGLSKGVTPLQEASAYGAIANKGIYISPITFTKIEDSHNNVIIDNRPIKRYVMSKKNAYLLENMMQDVVKYGTGQNAKLPNMPVAGKTGTTDNYDNAWFTGFTPYYVGSVWMGFDNDMRIIDDNIGTVTGGSFPAELWKTVMADAHKGLKKVDFQMPSGLRAKYPPSYFDPNINLNTNQGTQEKKQNNQNVIPSIPNNFNNSNNSNSNTTVNNTSGNTNSGTNSTTSNTLGKSNSSTGTNTGTNTGTSNTSTNTNGNSTGNTTTQPGNGTNANQSGNGIPPNNNKKGK